MKITGSALASIVVLACANACAQTPAWQLSGSAARVDPPEGAAPQSVWIRLTPDANNTLGMALLQGVNIVPQNGLTVSFDYMARGGGPVEGDGISLFLFDPAKGMAGAQPGGGLGYCRGSGGWFGLAIDEFGNFSHPQDRCGNGPGPHPRSVVLRGPAALGNPFVASAPIPATRQQASNTADRPGVAEVSVHLWPRPEGYTVAVDWRPGPANAWRPLIDHADFPFAAPPSLALGVAASTGMAKNEHEIGGVRVVAHTGVAVNLRFDPPEPADRSSTLIFDVGGGNHRESTFVRNFRYELPAGLEIANPPGFGGTCEASVRAKPQGGAVTIDAGSKVRPGGCTVSVKVVARGPGWYVGKVPAGTMLTDTGTNAAPASATLAVSR